MRPYFSWMIGVGLLGVAGFVGCVEERDMTEFHSDRAERNQAVMVIPEFSITGTGTLPAELYLTELGLSVTEIRLEPISGRQGLAYSTSRPFSLSFDVAQGELVKQGEPVEFPEAGRFIVSVRLEPQRYYDEALQTSVTESSLSIAGFIAGGLNSGAGGGDLTGNDKDGNPLPLPFDEVDGNHDEEAELVERDGTPMDWTPFHYDSKRAVFYTFSDVEIVPGEQFLTFTFDIRDWAIDLIDPIVRAVSNSDAPQIRDGQGVDITTQLDSTGSGAEALMDKVSVQSTPRQPGVDPGL